MRRVGIAFVLGLLLPAGNAAAALRPAPCTSIFDVAGARCGTLTVPLDRSGQVPGTTKLFVERIPARHSSGNAMVLFPGGPGAASTLIGTSVVGPLRAGLADHDLLLLDARGTGRSGYLDCDVALAPTYFVPAGQDALQLSKTVERCAKQLGARRSLYTTQASVEDLEAVRRALGIDKLVLIGVSYGTRTAMAYARTYPDH